MISDVTDNVSSESMETNQEIPVESDLEQAFSLERQSQITDSVEAIRTIPEVTPENWDTLEPQERLDTLQTVENALSDIQNRPSAEIHAEDMPANTFGCWDGEVIRINSNHLTGEYEQPVSEMVDTVVHEGRHAYQSHAINNPGFLGNDAIEQEWRDNDANYLDVSLVGQEAYLEQPLEADAWDFASAIRSGSFENGEAEHE
jgi:hypothetical protein